MKQPTLSWPPRADEHRLGLQTLLQRVQIDVAPAQVWRYVTDAAHWAQWQPGTRRVQTLAPGPQPAGSEIVEHRDTSKAGAKGSELVRWRVLAAEPPRLWVAAADTPLLWLRLLLRLQPLGTDATELHYGLDLRSASPLRHWADRWLLPGPQGRAAAAAMAALKLRLEAAHPPPEVAPPPVPRWRAER